MVCGSVGLKSAFYETFCIPYPFGESSANSKQGCYDAMIGYKWHHESNVDDKAPGWPS